MFDDEIEANVWSAEENRHHHEAMNHFAAGRKLYDDSKQYHARSMELAPEDIELARKYADIVHALNEAGHMHLYRGDEHIHVLAEHNRKVMEEKIRAEEQA